MEATFPSRAVTRGVAVAGALGLVGAVAVFVLDFRDDLAAIVWFAPFVGAYLAGLFAWRLQPDQVAARRLLVFGTVAALWIAATVGLVVAYEAQGNEWWLGPANVAVQSAGLTMEAALIALLAIYPNGRHLRAYERRTVQVATALSLAVPLALLVSYETVQPSWGFSWGAEDAIAFPAIASPLHVAALGFLGPPARVLLEGALLLGPIVATTLVAMRYRGLTRRQEMQVRWPMYGVFVLLLLPLAALLHEFGDLPLAVYDAVVIVALLALPASIVIGLVKPDLFDVDRAMSRSFLYAPLWLAIAAAYLGIAAALGVAASAFGLQVTVAVTIVVTLLVEPARRRLATRAERWTRGASLDGEQMLRWLGENLEHTLDQRELTAAVARAATEGLGVRWTTVRLAGVDPVTHGERKDEAPAASAELVHAGEHLGDIECGPRVGTLAVLGR